MKKLVFLSTVVALMMPAGFAVAAGGDGNRIAMNQAWAAVRGDQKKQAAAEKAMSEQLQALFTPSQAKKNR
jgi:hypothetical protein